MASKDAVLCFCVISVRVGTVYYHVLSSNGNFNYELDFINKDSVRDSLLSVVFIFLAGLLPFKIFILKTDALFIRSL